MDIGCTLGITVVALGLSAMFYGYKIKTDRKSITLEKNDKQHEHKHVENVERIKKLEEKNKILSQKSDKELAEIEQLNGKITILEGIINKWVAQPQPVKYEGGWKKEKKLNGTKSPKRTSNH